LSEAVGEDDRIDTLAREVLARCWRKSWEILTTYVEQIVEMNDLEEPATPVAVPISR
jgi:hypothetical protein